MGKVGKQKAGLRIQDSIVLNLLSEKSSENDLYTSAHYRHRLHLPIGMAPDRFNEYNSKCRDDYYVALRTWTSCSTSRRQPKPKQKNQPLNSWLVCAAT